MFGILSVAMSENVINCPICFSPAKNNIKKSIKKTTCKHCGNVFVYVKKISGLKSLYYWLFGDEIEDHNHRMLAIIFLIIWVLILGYFDIIDKVEHLIEIPFIGYVIFISIILFPAALVMIYPSIKK